MKRIHKVKTAVIVKDTIPDEKIEILRDNCNNLRDRAMIDFLLCCFQNIVFLQIKLYNVSAKLVL